MEKVNCLICNTSNKKSILPYKLKDSNSNLFFLAHCIHCDFSYLNPRPSIKEISQYYDNTYLPHISKKNTLLSYIYNLIQKVTFYWKKSIIDKYSSDKMELIDIGSGNNKFIEYLGNFNYKCSSYDEFSKQADFKYLKDIPNKKYNHITLWHSIEHIHNIDTLFKKINKISNSNTYLYIACPNFNAIERKKLKDDWPAYDAPRHLYHFQYDSMKKLLKKYNFQIISTSIMLQDTCFNIIMSKNIFLFKKIYLLIYSFIAIFFNRQKASSLLYICKLK